MTVPKEPRKRPAIRSLKPIPREPRDRVAARQVARWAHTRRIEPAVAVAICRAARAEREGRRAHDPVLAAAKAEYEAAVQMLRETNPLGLKVSRG